MIGRREFITLLSGGAAWPVAPPAPSPARDPPGESGCHRLTVRERGHRCRIGAFRQEESP
jgi:hypothetical protein